MTNKINELNKGEGIIVDSKLKVNQIIGVNKNHGIYLDGLQGHGKIILDCAPTTSVQGIQFVQSGLTSTNSFDIGIGIDSTNSGYIRYYYNSTTPANTYMSLGYSGLGSNLTIYQNGSGTATLSTINTNNITSYGTGDVDLNFSTLGSGKFIFTGDPITGSDIANFYSAYPAVDTSIKIGVNQYYNTGIKWLTGGGASMFLSYSPNADVNIISSDYTGISGSILGIPVTNSTIPADNIVFSPKTLRSYVNDQSTGCVGIPNIIDAIGGNIYCSSIDVYIRASNSDTANLVFLTVANSTLAHDAYDTIKYVCIHCTNSTTAAYELLASIPSDYNTYIPIAAVYKVASPGTELYINKYYTRLSNKTVQNQYDSCGAVYGNIQYVSGSEIGFIGLKYSLTKGKFRQCSNLITLSAKLEIDTFIPLVHVAGVYTELTATNVVNYLQYDNGTQLTNLSAGRYGKWCIFRTTENRNYLVPTTANETSVASALSVALPTFPQRLITAGILLGVIITRQSVAAINSIYSAFSTSLTNTAVTSHSNLSNLSSDDHPQYALLSGRTETDTLNIDNIISFGAATNVDLAIEAKGLGHIKLNSDTYCAGLFCDGPLAPSLWISLAARTGVAAVVMGTDPNGIASIAGHTAALDNWAPLNINRFNNMGQANTYIGGGEYGLYTDVIQGNTANAILIAGIQITNSQIPHSSTNMSGLANDTHSQYALLSGRTETDTLNIDNIISFGAATNVDLAIEAKGLGHIKLNSDTYCAGLFCDGPLAPSLWISLAARTGVAAVVMGTDPNGIASIAGHTAALDNWAPLNINRFNNMGQANTYIGGGEYGLYTDVIQGNTANAILIAGIQITNSQIPHSSTNMSGLANDTHSQYALLSGRTGDVLNIDTIQPQTPDGNITISKTTSLGIYSASIGDTKTSSIKIGKSSDIYGYLSQFNFTDTTQNSCSVGSYVETSWNTYAKFQKDSVKINKCINVLTGIASPPSTEGNLFYDNTAGEKCYKYYNGTAWITLGKSGSNDIDPKLYILKSDHEKLIEKKHEYTRDRFVKMRKKISSLELVIESITKRLDKLEFDDVNCSIMEKNKK